MDAGLTDEQVESIAEKYSNLVTGLGAEVQAAGRWDKRRLAYEVKGRREGIYILMYFSGEPAVAKELDRNFRIADEILRHIIVRVEPEHVDISRIGQPPAEEEAEQPEEQAEYSADAAEAAEPAAELPEAETPAQEPAPADEVAEEPVSEPEAGEAADIEASTGEEENSG